MLHVLLRGIGVDYDIINETLSVVAQTGLLNFQIHGLLEMDRRILKAKRHPDIFILHTVTPEGGFLHTVRVHWYLVKSCPEVYLGEILSVPQLIEYIIWVGQRVAVKRCHIIQGAEIITKPQISPIPTFIFLGRTGVLTGI